MRTKAAKSCKLVDFLQRFLQCLKFYGHARFIFGLSPPFKTHTHPMGQRKSRSTINQAARGKREWKETATIFTNTASEERMILESRSPCRGFTFTAYVQHIVQPRAEGSHWFVFEGVQSRLDFSFIAHEKKRKKKSQKLDLHNFAKVEEAPNTKFNLGWTFFSPFLLRIYIKKMG